MKETQYRKGTLNQLPGERINPNLSLFLIKKTKYEFEVFKRKLTPKLNEIKTSKIEAWKEKWESNNELITSDINYKEKRPFTAPSVTNFQELKNASREAFLYLENLTNYWASVKGDLGRFQKFWQSFQQEMSSLRISPPKRTSPAPGGRSPPGSATQASQVSDIYKGSLNSEFLCNEISYLAGKVKKVLTTLTKMHLTNEIFLKDFVVTKDLKIMQENLKNYQEFDDSAMESCLENFYSVSNDLLGDIGSDMSYLTQILKMMQEKDHQQSERTYAKLSGQVGALFRKISAQNSSTFAKQEFKNVVLKISIFLQKCSQMFERQLLELSHMMDVSLQGNKTTSKGTRKHRKEWRILFELTKTFKLEIEILSGKSSMSSTNAYQPIIDELQGYQERISTAVSFYWKKTVISKKQAEIAKSIQKVRKKLNSTHKQAHPDKNKLSEIHRMISKVKFEVKRLKTIFGKYSTFDFSSLDLDLKDLNYTYDSICFKLCGVSREPLLQDLEYKRTKKSDSDVLKKTIDNINLQAELPEENERFITQQLNHLIENERYSEFPNHIKVENYTCLKTIFKNYAVFEEVLVWVESLKTTICDVQFEVAGNRFRQVVFLFEEFLRYDEKCYGFIQELERHIQAIEELVSSDKLDKKGIQAAIIRLEVEKDIIELIDYIRNSFHSLVNCWESFSELSNHCLSFMNPDHIQLMQKGYLQSFDCIEALKARSGELATKYRSGTLIPAIITECTSFSQHLMAFLNFEVVPNIRNLVAGLSQFLASFETLENILTQIDEALNESISEREMLKILDRFEQEFQVLTKSKKMALDHAYSVSDIFRDTDSEDFLLSYDFMLMHEEILKICRTIILDRVSYGNASQELYGALNTALEDKPEPVRKFLGRFALLFR